MRVWNSGCSSNVTRPITFWSYLWGFETIKRLQSNVNRDSFGVTYEGLKPLHLDPPAWEFFVLELPMRVWNWVRWSWGELGRMVLELPMRVWNYHRLLTISSAARCFGVTYEGLKLLPKVLLRRLRYPFWSYLWGFETRRPKIKKDGWQSFWSYLWGFETPAYSKMPEKVCL